MSLKERKELSKRLKEINEKMSSQTPKEYDSDPEKKKRKAKDEIKKS